MNEFAEKKRKKRLWNVNSIWYWKPNKVNVWIPYKLIDYALTLTSLLFNLNFLEVERKETVVLYVIPVVNTNVIIRKNNTKYYSWRKTFLFDGKKKRKIHFKPLKSVQIRISHSSSKINCIKNNSLQKRCNHVW